MTLNTTLEKYDQSAVATLVAELNSHNAGWSIEDQKLTKLYVFKNFVDAFGFMTQCALYAEKVNHHPEWFNVYSRVSVQLITHDVSGISFKDAQLARQMDIFAARLLETNA